MGCENHHDKLKAPPVEDREDARRRRENFKEINMRIMRILPYFESGLYTRDPCRVVRQQLIITLLLFVVAWSLPTFLDRQDEPVGRIWP